MNDSIDFRAKDRSSYSIRLIDGTVRMECYLMGSISGGTGAYIWLLFLTLPIGFLLVVIGLVMAVVRRTR